MGQAKQRYFWGFGWENFYTQFWSEEEIINRIRSLSNQGRPINLAAVAAAGEWYLIRASTHYFGSWRKAVEAAGFNYDDVRADIRWTPEKVIQEIRRLRRRRKDISSRATQLQYPDLFAGAVRKRLFGSWEKAIEASGVPYDRVRKYHNWSDDRLRAGIRALEAAGVRLNARSVHTADHRLYYAACHRYRSWGKALHALGYNVKEIALRRPWSADDVRAHLKELHQKGVHLSDNNVRRLHPALHAAACRTFGTWTRARAACPPVKPRTYRHLAATAYLPGFAP